jgi:hypothetical protein
MRILAAIAVAAVTCQPVLAKSAQSACISPKQAEGLMGYALPSVIAGTSKRCAGTLANESFLKANGEALASRYAARKDANWPAAKDAFLTMSNGKDDASKVLRQLPDSSLREMIDVILEGMIVQEIPVSDCGKIDSFVRLLAPLPPENTAELLALTMSMVGNSKPAKPGAMAIC